MVHNSTTRARLQRGKIAEIPIEGFLIDNLNRGIKIFIPFLHIVAGAARNNEAMPDRLRYLILARFSAPNIVVPSTGCRHFGP
jgi:hypothetical protein